MPELTEEEKQCHLDRDVTGAFDSDGHSVEWNLDTNTGYPEWVKAHIEIGHEIKIMSLDDACGVIMKEDMQNHKQIQ